MNRSVNTLLLVSMVIGLSLGGCAQHNNNSLAQSANSPVKNDSTVLDGSYEFVSEVTEITAPERKHDERTSQEWEGIWLFRDGRFSQTMVKRQRLEWTPSHFPDDARKLGFDAACGRYKLDGKTMVLDYDLTFYPGKAGRTEILTYSFNGNVVTFIQELRPSRESVSTGQRTLVLRRVS